MPPVAKTVRKNRSGKDVSGTFGPDVEVSKVGDAVEGILQKYEENL